MNNYSPKRYRVTIESTARSDIGWSWRVETVIVPEWPKTNRVDSGTTFTRWGARLEAKRAVKHAERVRLRSDCAAEEYYI